MCCDEMEAKPWLSSFMRAKNNRNRKIQPDPDQANAETPAGAPPAGV